MDSPHTKLPRFTCRQ